MRELTMEEIELVSGGMAKTGAQRNPFESDWGMIFFVRYEDHRGPAQCPARW